METHIKHESKDSYNLCIPDEVIEQVKFYKDVRADKIAYREYLSKI